MKRFIFVALLLAAGPALAAEKPEVKTADRNGDGRIDQWTYLRDGKTYRTARDTNGDGKPDRFTLFIKGRNLVLRETDVNKDGYIDQRALASWDGNKKIMIGGVPPRSITSPGYDNLWSETDNDFDGKIDQAHEKGKKSDAAGRVGNKINGKPTLEISDWEKSR